MNQCLKNGLLSLFFIALPWSVSAVTSLALNAKEVVPEIVALGISPKVQKIFPQRLQKNLEEEDRYYLQVLIGKVNAEQFKKLKALYGNTSQVAYDAAKSYDLIDFLPPAIQATVNKTLTPKTYDLSKLPPVSSEQDPDEEEIWGIRKSGVAFYTNCWNTTIETLKFLNPSQTPANNTYHLMWPGRWDTNDLMSDDQYSTKIASKDLRGGDVLIVSQQAPNVEDFSMIQHTAMVLGPNLMFEKTDTQENDPYRLSLRADVLKKYKRIFPQDGVLTYRRFGGDKKPLPTEIKYDVYSAKNRKILLRAQPDLPIDKLSWGCESGLMGGCDPVITVVEKVQLRIDPKNGRGFFSGPESVLSRFRDITQEP